MQLMDIEWLPNFYNKSYNKHMCMLVLTCVCVCSHIHVYHSLQSLKSNNTDIFDEYWHSVSTENVSTFVSLWGYNFQCTWAFKTNCLTKNQSNRQSSSLILIHSRRIKISSPLTPHTLSTWLPCLNNFILRFCRQVQLCVDRFLLKKNTVLKLVCFETSFLWLFSNGSSA